MLKSKSSSSFLSVEDATNYLLDHDEHLGVNHLSYWYLQYSDGLPDQVIWVATYDPAYMSYYMQHFTPVSDPVIASVMEDKYVDWSEWLSTDELAQDVAIIAPRYGITEFGISIPIAAKGHDKVIFSACMKSCKEDWPKDRMNLARRLLPFADQFHLRMQNLIVNERVDNSVFRIFA
jgi:Autoinducer binding domain